jgi:hypothetical protein
LVARYLIADNSSIPGSWKCMLVQCTGYSNS